ncbi:uncharacterized protein LOC133173890 [Saccostrea echinata]|uniref:uncharacterized protein LOC133173890 n=1 Tax=Saccostrea echinata TaxID=191078 RepID=UPI002A8384C5|nr:uncharacterized protein LOC133173890 [Saccostrea echinata]
MTAADIELTSNETYQQMSFYCISAQGRSHIEFWVNSTTDVHFALMTEDTSTPRINYSQFYEIVIGGWHNTESCIRAQSVQCKKVSTPGILDGSMFVQFWVSWDNDHVYVGKGPKSSGIVMLSETKPGSYEVNYFAVMTHHKSVWRFVDDTECEMREFNNTDLVTEDKSCNGITTYRCKPGFLLTGGNLTRTCMIGRVWDGEPPVCTDCGCTSTNHVSTNMSIDYLKERISQLTKELKIHKNVTSSYWRSKTSAPDYRISSRGIGYTLGYGLIGFMLGVIFISDLQRIANNNLQKRVNVET